MHSNHQGNFWVGSYERKGDGPQGTLTSAPFKVTHPWGAFLVGGGPHPTTCVELVRRDTTKVFFRVSGEEKEDMRRVAVDLRPHKGKEIFIRLVDHHIITTATGATSTSTTSVSTPPSPTSRPRRSSRRPPTSSPTPGCRPTRRPR
jgi:hypothetical protein